MRRTGLCLIAACALSGAAARSQVIFPGSTPQGDYLRGLGVAASGFGDLYTGMGNYNVLTAQAESINADTAIKVDMYVNMVLRQGRDNWQLLERQRMERVKAGYNAIRKRVSESPEWVDVMAGKALNAKLDELSDPKYQESSFRSIKIPLPPNAMRQIPFKLDEKGVAFSVQGLAPRSREKWPVAFQDPRYDQVREAFIRAVDEVLELTIEGRMTARAIERYASAVDALDRELEAQFGPESRDRRFNEGKLRIAEFRRATETFKAEKMQKILKELDTFGGATIADLRKFMKDHGLRFGTASTPEEKGIYSDLYAGLLEVSKVMNEGGPVR